MNDIRKEFREFETKNKELENKVFELQQANSKLRAEKSELVEVVAWMLNLHHGVGQSSYSPSDQEWEDCLNRAENLLLQIGSLE